MVKREGSVLMHCDVMGMNKWLYNTENVRVYLLNNMIISEFHISYVSNILFVKITDKIQMICSLDD